MRQLFDGGPALLRGQCVMACRDEGARAKVLLDLYVLAPADHMHVDDTHVLVAVHASLTASGAALEDQVLACPPRVGASAIYVPQVALNQFQQILPVERHIGQVLPALVGRVETLQLLRQR